MQPLNKLDGLTVWHETRLEEEDVENVPNMASVDIVELMLYTQIPMERLVSWIDQAILLTVLGHDATGDRDSRKTAKARAANGNPGVRSRQAASKKVLRDALGADLMAALVSALKAEANFDGVRAWREVMSGAAAPSPAAG